MPGPNLRYLVSRAAVWTLFLLAALLQACGPSWAPVEDRSTPRGTYQRDAFRLTADGRYRVRRGDTLHAIAFNYGLDWRDLADWNRIRAPYTIYPDQELRLSPPQPAVAEPVVTRPAPAPSGAVSRERPAETVPAPTAPAPATPTAAAPPPTGPAPTQVEPAPPARATAPPPLQDPDRWLWPTDGRVLSRFQPNDPARNGIDIGGSEGQPVRAAAPGEVVYSGSGLIGYGELIIVKHSDRMLSAYAHNRQRLVSEGQRVAAGEQLAEMGRNDRNQAMLHFEIRVDGTPRDPLRFLPQQ